MSIPKCPLSKKEDSFLEAKKKKLKCSVFYARMNFWACIEVASGNHSVSVTIRM